MKVIKKEAQLEVLQGSYLEFIEYAKNQPKSEKAKNANSNDSRKGDFDFTATKSFEEAVELAEYGWDAGIKQLGLSDGVLVSGNGMEVNENVCGSLVNIGNYVQGLPNNMYEFTEVREYNLEPLTIYIPLTYSARNSSEKALKYTKALIEKINEYQTTNAVKLIGFFDSDQSNGWRYISEVLIKDIDERFVINNVAFAFHPSFFRRLYFAHIETFENLDTSGYGRPLKREISLSYIKSKDNEFVLLPNLNDLDSNFTEEQFNNQIISNA
jgi:hypothetical protein